MTTPRTRSGARTPPIPAVPEGYSVLPGIEHQTTVQFQASITDTFVDPHLSNWVVLAKDPEVVSGQLQGEGVLRHRDAMMTDDFLVTAVIGEKQSGKTRIVICADKDFTTWYAAEVETGITQNKLHIVKGRGVPALLEGGLFSSAVTKHASVNQTVAATDEVGVRYDEELSTVRVYLNGVEKTSLYVPRWEIPHGPDFRYWGVATGVDLFLGFINEGVMFTSITAEDYTPPVLPDYIDTFDNAASLDNWTILDDGVAIKKHWFEPNSLGPDNVFFTDATVLHDATMDTDSVKVIVKVANYGFGKFAVALCSNAAMTNWAGVEFETGLFNNYVHIIKGTGPSTYSYVGDKAFEFTTTGEIFAVSYNKRTNTFALYRAYARGAPVISWKDASNTVTHGSTKRRTGLLWHTSLLFSGVEPTRWEAYNRPQDES